MMIGGFAEVCRRKGLKMNADNNNMMLLEEEERSVWEFIVGERQKEYVSEFKNLVLY